MEDIHLPPMNSQFHEKLETFRSMTKMDGTGQELPVSETEAQAVFNSYIQSALEENRKRIFDEAEQFIEDLKNGTF